MRSVALSKLPQISIVSNFLKNSTVPKDSKEYHANIILDHSKAAY
jgi:hypothetical protein